VAGSPARIIRELSDEEIEWKGMGTRQYQDLTIRSLNTMQEVEPLTEVEPDRKRLSFDDSVIPLSELKQRSARD
jgi:phenylacetic acid degradation protein